MRKTTAIVACSALIVFAVASVFAFSVGWRQPWFSTIGRPITAQFLTNWVLMTRNWSRENPVALGFGAYLLPYSAEYVSLDERSPYTGYPPGLIVPVYAAGKMLGREPTLEFVMRCNLASQFLTALLLSFLALALLRSAGRSTWDAAWLAPIPGVLYVLLPAPMYYHQMRHVPDVGVIPLFVAYVLIECLRGDAVRSRSRLVLAILQAGVGFLGMLTDWLFAPVALCVYAKRAACGELGGNWREWMRHSLAMGGPIAAALVLYALQLLWMDAFRNLGEKLSLWKPSPGHRWLDNYFWKVHFVRGYGEAGVTLAWFSLACMAGLLLYVSWKRFRRHEMAPGVARCAKVAFLTAAPCFLYLVLLGSHASFPLHGFSVLKFAVAIALAPFLVAPMLLQTLLDPWPRAAWIRRAVPVLFCALALGYAHLEWPNVAKQFGPRPKPDTLSRAAEFVAAVAEKDDVVFTNDSRLAIDSISPYLALSMALVHATPSLQGIYNVVAGIDAGYTVDLLFDARQPVPESNIARLVPLARERHESGDGLLLLRVDKPAFIQVCLDAHVSAPLARPLFPSGGQMGLDKELIRRMSSTGIDVEALSDATSREPPESK